MDGFAYVHNRAHSEEQRRYTQQRLAALALARERAAATTGSSSAEEASMSSQHVDASAQQPGGLLRPFSDRRKSSHSDKSKHGSLRAGSGTYGDTEGLLKLPTTPNSTGSSTSAEKERASGDFMRGPFELRNGRRYLRDVPYPLPIDLVEVQRQNIQTLLQCKVFGRPVCSPRIDEDVPKRVLEICCGSGYWSAMCHDHFSVLGHENVSFTGFDIAPLAADLRKQGVRWTFVQHDLRRVPWPFADEHFDLVMIKDVSMVLTNQMEYQAMIDEAIRLLRPEGSVEIWEVEHSLRSLQPHPPVVSKRGEEETAMTTATIPVSPATPFTTAHNKSLRRVSAWITEALDRRNILPTPCGRIAPVLYQETEALSDVGTRRVAIPLAPLSWERGEANSSKSNSPKGSRSKAKMAAPTTSPLTEEQSGLRQAALLTVVQKIESLEPLLKEVSGKSSEEWSHWWSTMMAGLFDPTNGPATDECLEVGAFWATKLGRQ